MGTKTKTQQKKTNRVDDLYQQVTDKLVKEIESGNLDNWIKKWSATGLPTNIVTRKPYRGINTLMLTLQRENQGYGSQLWATYHQISQVGGTVLRGETATPILFQKRELIVKDEDIDTETGEVIEQDERRYRWVARTYQVFNLDQTDLEPGAFEINNLESGEVQEQIEKLINAIPATKKIGGNICAYLPIQDLIRLPLVQSFETYEEYYASLFHELIHWTGHHTRLNRPWNKVTSEDGYAKEELVAELGAAMLCAKFGLEGNLQHSEYLGHWLEALKADSKYLYFVALMAQTAVDYILKFLD